MKQLKKTIVSLVMALLLAVTLIPSTNVTVQAASVGKVTGIKAEKQNLHGKKHPEPKNMKSTAQPTVRNLKK